MPTRENDETLIRTSHFGLEQGRRLNA